MTKFFLLHETQQKTKVCLFTLLCTLYYSRVVTGSFELFKNLHETSIIVARCMKSNAIIYRNYGNDVSI